MSRECRMICDRCGSTHDDSDWSNLNVEVGHQRIQKDLCRGCGMSLMRWLRKFEEDQG